MNEEAKTNVSAMQQVREMPAMFWIANGSEMLERLAFFGVRAVLPLYMFGADSVLQLSMTEKGVILGVWALIQCLLPMISGGYTEAFGYRKSLAVAFGLNGLGYLLMAHIPDLAGGSHASNFWLMMASGCLVGTGTAIFKPPCQGMVAKTLNEGNSGLGFGIFYWVVNIGGFVAPFTASALRGDEINPTWAHVFYGAALVTLINLVYCLLVFREPERDAAAAEKSSLAVFADTMKDLWRDQSLFWFLVIISGFWLMFMQVWDLLPNFIDEWVDTRDIGALMTSLIGDGAAKFMTADHAAKPEILINLDALTIILLVIPLSWFFGRYRMIVSLLLGMIIAMVGFVGAGLTQVGSVCGLFIIVFALGEIICSPKFSEYVGMTAPPDKKAQYMGYSNMPFAFGWFVGNLASGPLYDHFSSKTKLAGQYLVEHMGMSAAEVTAIKDNELFDTMVARLGEGADRFTAAELLWNAYHPWVIWLMLGGGGLLSVLGMAWRYARTGSQKSA
jgi:proton-dependent oligopeptide transporter, POT family